MERATSDSEREDMLTRAQTPSSVDLDLLGVATTSCNLCCKPPLGHSTVNHYTKQLQPPTAVHRNGDWALRDLVDSEPQETPGHI